MAVVTPGVPDGGTPAADLSSAVQASLALADSSAQRLTTVPVSTATTGVLAAWTLVQVDCTSAACARTLPAASSVADGTLFAAKKTDASSNALTIARAGSDTIVSSGSVSATSRVVFIPGEVVVLQSNGVDAWTVVGGDTPGPALEQRYSAAAPVDKLRVFRAAVGNRAYAPVRVACIGGSSFEGVGISAGATYGRHLWDQLLNRCRAQRPVSGVTGGPGFIPAWISTGNGVTQPWVKAGSPGSSNDTGWGLRSTTLSSAGHGMTYTGTMTSFEIWYAKFVGGGTFSITIDGGAPVNVNTNAATDRGAVWSSGALSADSHTIVVSYVSGGVCYIRGGMIYSGDEAAGWQFYNGAQAGRSSANFSGSSAQWTAHLAKINPHLVWIQLGQNDWQQSIPVSTYKTNMDAIIAAIRANTTTNPSIILYSAPETTNTATYGGVAWQAFKDVMALIASGDEAISLYDAALRVRSPRTDNTLGLYNTDLLHPTDIGHALHADDMAEYMFSSI